MLLNRLGNLEQESDLSDLEELERDLVMELAEEQPEEPQQMAPQEQRVVTTVLSAAPRQDNGFIIATRRGSGASKFAPQVTSPEFFPDQPAANAGENKAEAQQGRKRDRSASPLSLVDSKFGRRPRQRPANDLQPKLVETVDVVMTAPQTPKSTRSRFARATVETLLSVGALPLQLLIEIGRFRFAKEHRFNSLQRLEKALGQGNEDAERFLRYHPGALRKKKEAELAPPAPPAPGL